MLPAPVATFTLPSIHDDTPLDCRIYHPPQLTYGSSTDHVWIKKGAVIAHPYAPLGGCYDDPVVLSIVTELLKTGLVVGTFNFRGAASSRGRTSWTGKPELWDYISFVGFFIYYLHGLAPPTTSQFGPSSPGPTSTPLSPIQSALPGQSNPDIDSDKGTFMILGGYSYGSLITSNLPTTEAILATFNTVITGTAEAEIKLRALHLSAQWNAETEHHVRRGQRSLQASSLRASPHSAVFGGDESEPGTRRPSRESRRSVDLIRRSVDRSRTKLGVRSFNSEIGSPPLEVKMGESEMVVPSTHYLLISPLLPPISMFATLFTKGGGFRNERTGNASPSKAPSSVSPDEKFQTHPTLAIYGDKDFFTSSKKLRRWAGQLSAPVDSHFTCDEIKGAGHFWHEEGVDAQMRKRVRDWTLDALGCWGD